MKLKLLLAAASIAYIAVPAFCQKLTGEAVNLKFNLPVGSKFSNTITMDMRMNQTMGGNEIKVTTKITQGYLFNVIKDSAGWKTMTATFARIAINMSANGNSMEYDTDTPNNDTTGPMGKMGAVFGAMKNGHFAFTMNGNGEIGSVTGMKEMVKRIVAGMKGSDAAMASQTLSQTFNEDAFKQNLQQSFAVYPGKPVKIGDTWSRKLHMNNAGLVMGLANSYTLDSIVNGVAKVKLVSKISVPPGSTIQGLPVNITGTMSGENGFDLLTGMPVDANLMMKVNMQVSAQGQQVPMTIKTNIIIEGKKL